MHSQTKDLLAIVKRGEAEEIEAARDLVRPELLPELLAAYWTLLTWDDKAGLMQLFSDHFTTGGEQVMLDFLTAPTTELNDEYYTSGKIVALCQLAGTFEIDERLWYNRPLCTAVIQHALAGETPTLALVNALDKPQSQAQLTPSAKLPKWLWALCGALALVLAAWGGYLLLTGEIAGGIQPPQERADLVLPQWVSMAALILLFLLPILLTWATVVWWARSEQARQQKAQQEGEVFVIQPLNCWGVLFSAYGMLDIAVVLFLVGRVDGRNLLELLFVPGIFAAIGIGFLAFFRHTTGLVLLTAERVAVRRLWMRERAMRYAEIESIRPMVFALPPVMLLRGGGRKLQIPRTAQNLPRLYTLLLERAPALRANLITARHFTLPDHGKLFNALDRWLMSSQTLVALELSPLELRYQRKGEDWRARSVQDIARIDWETVRTTRRAVSTTPHINLDTHDIIVTFRDGEQLRIRERNVVQFGTTPEQLREILQELYGK